MAQVFATVSVGMQFETVKQTGEAAGQRSKKNEFHTFSFWTLPNLNPFTDFQEFYVEMVVLMCQLKPWFRGWTFATVP